MKCTTLAASVLGLALLCPSAASQGIVINEFVAKNNSGAKDEKGQFEDWLELYNTTTSEVTVGGLYLSDDSTKPTKWQIPTGTKIPAKGTLLVWCDEDGTDGPLHANFKLAGSTGEEILLVASDGKKVLDQIKFGPQLADVATGRLLDGGAPWVTLPTPTPKAANAPATCGVRVYNQLAPTNHRITIGIGGTPKVNGAITVALSKGPVSGNALLFAGLQPGHLPLGGPSVVFLAGGQIFGPITIKTDIQARGSVSIQIPNIPALAGLKVYAQAGGIDGTGFTASNGLEVIICK